MEEASTDTYAAKSHIVSVMQVVRSGVEHSRIESALIDRPETVEQKMHIKDWEGDTVIGKNHKGRLVTLADRLSRYVLAGHIPSKHAGGVIAVTMRLFEPYKDQCHIITFDNGKEFAEHESIVAGLQAAVYFAHPYHSWERGLNENNNGLLRQYFPKEMELTDLSDEQVQKAVDKLNHRPRKALGYRTPHEIFFEVRLRYTKQLLVVALQS